jgi:hypothetical protein
MCATALVVLFVIAVLAVPPVCAGIRRSGPRDPDRARSGGGPRRTTAPAARAAGRRRMPARVLVQPDVRYVRAQRRHAVPRLPVARRELPDRVDLLADVAHVRRGRVLRSLS